MPSPITKQMDDAINAGNIAKVTQLLDTGADVNGVHADIKHLRRAIEKKKRDIILLLLNRGAHIDPVVDSDLVVQALLNDYPDVVRLMRQKGIPANTTHNNHPLLSFAQSVEGAAALVEPIPGSPSADVNMIYSPDKTMMDYFLSIPQKHIGFNIAFYLLRNGANPTPRERGQPTILHVISDPNYVSSNTTAIEVIDYIRERYPSPSLFNRKGKFGSTPFKNACTLYRPQHEILIDKFLSLSPDLVDINEGNPAPIYSCNLQTFEKILDNENFDITKPFIDLFEGDAPNEPPVYIVNGFLQTQYYLFDDNIENDDNDNNDDNPELNRVFRKLLQKIVDIGDAHVLFMLVEPYWVNEKVPLETAADFGCTGAFQALLEVGAPVVEITDAMWAKYDAGGYKPEIRALFPPRTVAPPVSLIKPLWAGITKSQASLWNMIFDFNAPPGEKPPAYKYSFCPTCFKIAMTPEERRDGCLFIKHNCLDEVRTHGGYVHRELWDKYKCIYGGREYMEWCAVCGRVSEHNPAIGAVHNHYPIVHHSAPKPASIRPAKDADYYKESMCKSHLGGGGWEEKVQRVRRMREMVKQLLPQVGTITMEDAKKQIIEAMWDAPLSPMSANESYAVTEKKWKNSNNSFLENVKSNVAVSTAPVAPAPNVLRPAADREDPDLQPRRIESGFNAVGANDNVPVIQFRHRKQNGDKNYHEDAFIGVSTFVEFIQNQVMNFGDPAFPRCYLWPECDAYLYPEEVQPFVPAPLYEEYKRKFNAHFVPKIGNGGAGGAAAAMVGGGDEPFLQFAEDAQCSIKPRRGGRMTFKKRRVARRTRRRGVKKHKRNNQN